MGDARASGLFATLRAALSSESGRHLVGVRDERDRARVVAGLAGAGEVLLGLSPALVASSLRPGGFDLAIVDLTTEAGAAAFASRVDVVRLVDADPAACAEAILAGAAAVLPRPLPESEALLHAHLGWLVACRRARMRGLAWPELLARHGRDIEELAPTFALALGELAERDAGRARPTGVMPVGAIAATTLRAALAGTDAAALREVETAPDVVLLAVGAADPIEQRLREVRTRAAGAAVVLLDSAPSAARVTAALYGGARAALTAAELPRLPEVLAAVGTRRRAEVVGRRLSETLARFGGGGARDASAAAPDVDAQLISEVAASSGSFVPSGHEVLVVDDEPVVVTVLREALRRGGYRVTTAASAEEAIAMFEHRSFDLVLTDKNLPGKSGLEVLRVARGLDPPPAVVLITGYSSYDSAIEAFDVGALDYIEKPIKDLESLRQRVRRALSRRDEQLAQQAKLATAAPVPAGTAPRPRVLLVEGEGARRELMAGYLGRAYDVTTVSDGGRALVRLEAERFDVVLADRNLVGLSGLRVIEQARRLLPHCAAVLYTAYPSYETVKEAFELGVDAFCVRPSEDLKALGEKVAGALRSRGGILLG